MSFSKTEIAVACAVLVVVVALVFFSVKEQMAWNDWSAQHCRETGYIKGRTFTTIGSDGKTGTTFESDRRTYKCDDGKEYTR